MEHIERLLADRAKFTEQIEEDIKKNEEMLTANLDKLKSIQETISNVKSLSQQPQKSALIPLAKNIFMNGRIVHTGEYFIKRTAQPESYSYLQTANQTVTHLEGRAKEHQDCIQRIEALRNQLEERLNVLGYNEEATDMPNEIKSDKGVAVKVGQYYEILEFEND